MPVQRPSRVLLRNIPLRFIARRTGGHTAKPVDSDLPLLPVIDLMICMVVFLLMSFSASGDLLAQRPSIEMPSAATGHELEPALTLVVDPVVVLLDEQRVADTVALAADAKVERIEPLIQALETMKQNWALLHPGKEFRGELTLQADVSIDYRVIKKLMYSATQAGYGNVRFAVNRARP
jgi:biopolymer transport protein ExbD